MASTYTRDAGLHRGHAQAARSCLGIEMWCRSRGIRAGQEPGVMPTVGLIVLRHWAGEEGVYRNQLSSWTLSLHDCPPKHLVWPNTFALVLFEHKGDV